MYALISALGIKLLGNRFRDYMSGNESSQLFHVPSPKQLNKLIFADTGIEDMTEPGVLIHDMVELAKKIFRGLPLILQHDERAV